MTYNPKLTGERMNKVNEASPASETSDVERVVMREPFAWATFDGEGGYDLRLYDNNELYHDEWVQTNGAKYESWVFPLYRDDA